MLLPKISLLSFLFCFLVLDVASAIDLKNDLVYGAFAGFGGTGIEEEILVNNNRVSVPRNEGPGMVGISVELYLRDKWTLALSHRRGFKLGPFNTGVGFTGITVRRYFLRTAAYLPPKGMENSVTLQKWVPYIGLGGGLAQGRIKRDDAAGDVSGSGVFFGMHIGADYHLYPKMILRPEIFTSATFMDDSESPATLEEFALGVWFLFRI